MSNKYYEDQQNLNHRYFQNKGTVDINDSSRYSIYYCNYPSMVLRSANGTDLAVVNFKYDATSDIEKNIPRPVRLNSKLDNKQRFQVLFNKNNQSFVVTITNLCDDMIKFDFLKKDIEIQETDPPENLNKVNELHSGETYEICADQTNGSKRLKINKKISSDHNKGITLEEEEKKETAEKFGDYLYLNMSVKSNASKTLKSLFDGATWNITNFISRLQTAKIMCTGADEKMPCPHLDSTFGSVNCSGSYQRQCVPMLGTVKSKKSSSKTDFFKSFTSNAFGSMFKNKSSESSGTATLYYRQTIHTGTGEECMVEECCDSMEGGLNFNDCDDDCDSVSTDSNDEVEQIAVVAPEVTNDTTLNSYVAGITGGDVMKIQSHTTGMEYDYNISTQVAVIGMSMVEGDGFDFTEKSDYVEYSFYKEQLLGNKLMDIRVYDQDKCIMCMTDKPKNIMYPCGHNSLCHDCCSEFKKSQMEVKNKLECSMCRKNVMFTFVVSQ